MKKTSRKLALRHEAIRVLDGRAFVYVAGGNNSPPQAPPETGNINCPGLAATTAGVTTAVCGVGT
jgi:hypothetical protein